MSTFNKHYKSILLFSDSFVCFRSFLELGACFITSKYRAGTDNYYFGLTELKLRPITDFITWRCANVLIA